MYAPFRRPLKAAGNGHGDGGYGKPASNASHGSRRGRMLTSRGEPISGKGQRAAWIIKPKPAGNGTPVANLGMQTDFEDGAIGKVSAGLPEIVTPMSVPTSDRLMINVPHLNKAFDEGSIMGRTQVVSLQNGGPVSPSGPGAMGFNGNGPINSNVKTKCCLPLGVDVERGMSGALIGGSIDVNGPVGEKVSGVGDGPNYSNGPINNHEPIVSNGLIFNEAHLIECGKDTNTMSNGKEAEKSIEEKKALSQFFKAQEELLHDLKHFVRDFPWDTKKRIHETRHEVDDLCEEPGGAPQENVKSPPQSVMKVFVEGERVRRRPLQRPFIPFISNLVESRGSNQHEHSRGHDGVGQPFREAATEVTLDKGIINDAWLHLFPKAILFNQARERSYPRGIRLRGPVISPPAFIVVDVLSRLVEEAIGKGAIHGIKLSRGGPVLSHLFFTDDLIQ
uniref:Uncharacterized protein n=1 Tax=Cannabis sativa TaxID=3483 RepID=A0A803P835_CANSA